MGILRFLLALAVVGAHAGGFSYFAFVDGVIAVQAFFIISGFYMSLVLQSKYEPGVQGYKVFITNRFLRLYPIYWIILIVQAGFSFGTGFFSEAALKQLDGVAILFLALANALMFGQDWAMFLAIEPTSGSLFFTPSFGSEQLPAWRFLLVPQAWSLGIELCFYLLAPWMCRIKIKYVVGLIVASLLFRVWLASFGYDQDPWLYRFFPLELMYFALGRLSFELYKKMSSKNFSKKFLLSHLAATLLLSAYYFYLPEFLGKKHLYMAWIVLSLPLLFAFTKNIAFDRWLGEFSYPIYIVHLFVLSIIPQFFTEQWGLSKSAIAAFASVLFAYILVRFVSQPIERFRQSRVQLSA